MRIPGLWSLVDNLSSWLRSRRRLRLSWHGCVRRIPTAAAAEDDLEAGPIWVSAGAFFDAPPGLINDWSLPDVKVAFFGTVQRLIAKGEASMWLEPSPDGCDRCL